MAYVPEADADRVMNLFYFFSLYVDGFLVLCSIALLQVAGAEHSSWMCPCTVYLGIFLKKEQHNAALGLLTKDNIIDNIKEPTEP